MRSRALIYIGIAATFMLTGHALACYYAVKAACLIEAAIALVRAALHMRTIRAERRTAGRASLGAVVGVAVGLTIGSRVVLGDPCDPDVVASVRYVDAASWNALLESEVW